MCGGWWWSVLARDSWCKGPGVEVIMAHLRMESRPVWLEGGGQEGWLGDGGGESGPEEGIGISSECEREG